MHRTLAIARWVNQRGARAVGSGPADCSSWQRRLVGPFDSAARRGGCPRGVRAEPDAAPEDEKVDRAWSGRLLGQWGRRLLVFGLFVSFVDILGAN